MQAGGRLRPRHSLDGGNPIYTIYIYAHHPSQLVPTLLLYPTAGQNSEILILLSKCKEITFASSRMRPSLDAAHLSIGPDPTSRAQSAGSASSAQHRVHWLSTVGSGISRLKVRGWMR